MAGVTQDDNNVFRFALQETAPSYVSTFTNYQIPATVVDTYDVFFTNYDSTIFSVTIDITSADTKQLSFDLSTFVGDGSVQ